MSDFAMLVKLVPILATLLFDHKWSMSINFQQKQNTQESDT